MPAPKGMPAETPKKRPVDEDQARWDEDAVPVETIEEDAEDKEEQLEIRGRGMRRRGRDN
jgi:hypothetical protein